MGAGARRGGHVPPGTAPARARGVRRGRGRRGAPAHGRLAAVGTCAPGPGARRAAHGAFVGARVHAAHGGL